MGIRSPASAGRDAPPRERRYRVIENFLRPPHGPAETGADVLRGVGVLSVILAAILFDLTDAGVLAFALPGLFVPRFLGMLPWPDVVVSTTLLIAAWSNVFDLYRRIPWWDLAVHFAGAGVLAAVLYLLLARVLVATAPHADGFTWPAAVVMTTSFSLALSASGRWSSGSAMHSSAPRSSSVMTTRSAIWR